MNRWMFSLLAAGVGLSLAGTGCRAVSTEKITPMQYVLQDNEEIRNHVLVKTMLMDDDAAGYNRQYKMPGPMPEGQPLYITIHNTYNVGPAINERNYVVNRRDQASISFHYAVDENGAIQILPDNQRGWHAGDGRGDGNMRSIGIEICRSRCTDAEGSMYYRAAENNAAKLAAWLLDTYGLADSALRKHQDWSGKYCPHRILDRENGWQEFQEKVFAARKR